MALHLPAPRLLPVTMLAMTVLLGVKSVGLLRLAVPAQAETADAAPPAAAAGKPTGTSPPPAAAVQPVAFQPPAVPPDAAGPAIPASERALLGDLRRRRAELDERAQAVAAREELVAAAEKRLAARLDELDSIQKRIEALEAARKARSEESWQGLVRIYETMKPKDAATIFDDLDMPVLVQVMDRMQERKAALVLASMDADRARALTVELADLRSSANKIPDAPMPVAATGSRPPLLPGPATPPH